MKTVSVIIPAYNEAAALPQTLHALRGLTEAAEIVVVDDGSDDDTADVARQHGVRVLRLAQNRGKGAALEAGVDVARGRVLVLLDADLGSTAAEAAKLMGPVLRDEADLVIGAFPAMNGHAGFGLVQTTARIAVRHLAGLHMQSPLSGQRAVKRVVLETVGGLAGGFGVEAALTIDAARAGFRVMEVPVAMRHRRTGRDVAGFVHRGRQFLHVARALAPRLWRRGVSVK